MMNLKNNKLYGNTMGCRIEWEDFIEWFETNEIQIRQLLRLL